ncbi:MAG: transcription termination factor Rho [Actinomycetota bacterium]
MAAEALEQSMLESKDKEQLLAIAQALGIKTNARAAKATLIDKILETTGVGPAKANSSAPAAEAAESNAAEASRAVVDEAPAVSSEGAAGATDSGATEAGASSPAEPEVVLGPDGEPLSDWEVELLRKGEIEMPVPRPAAASSSGSGSGDDDDDDEGDDDDDAVPGESRNARRRRRRRNKNRGEGQPANGAGDQNRSDQGRSDQGRGDQNRNDPNRAEPPRAEPGVAVRDSGPDLVSHEPVEVAGYLDLRDEGYGFLRVNGFLPSRDDAYVPVRLARQYGLRRGDHVTGLCRPAGRNEKNPALLEVHSVNGDQPDTARDRRRFEDLTALFPDSRLRLEHSRFEMTSRIIDLVAPIGKGQRGLIVSPPKAGKTSIMKTIATAIEHNHPEVVLMVLLVDERPEEVTDMRRSVKGEVIASTFDRPSDEHVHVAELAVERAKRLVEAGKDVVMIVDGITRLTRAYNLAAPPSGRILSGGIDAAALYPPKKLFGAARNVEEGGSLTILATALVDTNSRMDDAIFEEFKGTGNMELKLDRRLAERRVFPAIDVDGSSTRHEELLYDRKQLQQAWKLRRVLGGLTDGGNAAAAIELLTDRLQSFATNADFLAEIGKQGS